MGLLNNQTKVIRIECATKLNTVSRDQIPAKYTEQLQRANQESHDELEYMPDFQSGNFNLANFYYNSKQTDKGGGLPKENMGTINIAKRLFEICS